MSIITVEGGTKSREQVRSSICMDDVPKGQTMIEKPTLREKERDSPSKRKSG